MEEFHRISRLPPYVFNIVNELKAKARADGEDIIDFGYTLDYLLKFLADKKAKSVKICALLDKPSRRRVKVPIAYRGFTVPDEFIIGYGLDFNEEYRNLPDVRSIGQ